MQRIQATASGATFRPLTTLDELESAIAASFSQPVVIFKHSFTCGTSAEAHEELGLAMERPTSEWYIVDVCAGRQVAQTIAARFGIRHESPQVLLLVAGQVRWHASHHRVTRAGVDAALALATT